jgi:hypothetical protein
MGTDLYGPSVNIFDPFFGPTTEDSQTAQQMALIILETAPGSIDAFPDAGYLFEEQLLSSQDTTSIAMLPQDIEGGLLTEPAFADALVDVLREAQTSGGGVALSLGITVTGNTGDAVGFTLSAGG